MDAENRKKNMDSVRSRFASASSTYSSNSSVQQMVAEDLLAMLPANRPKRILELGCGTGFLTKLVLEKYSGAFLDAVDIAEDMVEVARRKTGNSDRVNWFVSDALDFKGEHEYQLIVSSSAFQWVESLRDLFSHLRTLLEPKGRILFSIMLRGTLWELHKARIKIAPEKPPAAQLAGLQEIEQALHKAGWRIVESQERWYSLRYSSADAMLDGLRRQGVTGGQVSRGVRPLTRADIRALKKAYTEMFADDTGAVRSSYRTAFFELEKEENQTGA